MPSRLSRISRSPIPKMWQCESVSPGTTVSAAEIDHPRSVEFSCVRVGTDEDNSAVFHRHGFRFRLLFVRGVDVSVDEHESTSSATAGRKGKRKAKKDQTKELPAFTLTVQL